MSEPVHAEPAAAVAPSPAAPARPRWQRYAGRALEAALWAWVFAAAVVLVARHWVLPEVDLHRPRIEQALGDALQRKVRIDSLSADWTGLHPQLSLRGLTLLDEAGQPALRLERVEAALGFSSLVRGELHLHRLDINSPDLWIRREADGRLFVAGLEIRQDGEQGGFTRWLLSQGQINIRDARLEWDDGQRPSAPPLQLTHVDMRLDNAGRDHRFGLSATPPAELASRLDIRGEVTLPDRTDLRTANGELFVSLEGADMAVWQTWVDYPMELPRGRGAARLWSRFDGTRLTGVTGELALADVQLRLAPALPLLDLVSLSGRVSAEQLSAERVVASARQLQLATRDGLALRPTSLDIHWQAATDRAPEHGEVSASTLDLDALTRLAGYLPLPDDVRERLGQHAAEGLIHELDGGWTGPLVAPEAFRVSARLEGLGLRAGGSLPGVRGLSGRIEGSDARGSVQIDAPGLVLDLPAVFPQPEIAFAQFKARAGWSRSDGETEVAIESLTFQNADVQGSAHGRYRTAGDSAGEIDLDAKLVNGDARAVWRYLPLSIGQDTRDWLRSALTAGRAPEATLKLRGRLDDFPFEGRPGVFQVKVKAEDVTVDFGSSWPPITQLRADVLFEGKRMLITSRDGRILNTRLGPTTAEIPDLEVAEELLLVKGSAAGPTAEFLRYIDASPVAERIDGFTSGMRAEGNGRLALSLTIPLRHSKDSRVEGEFVFAGNRLVVDSALPPLLDAAGKVGFTDSSLSIRGAQATVLGFPMTLDVGTGGGGVVTVDARGRASMEAVRAQFGQPWMNALSGTAGWQAKLGVRRNGLDMTVESDLAQVSSALPVPFGKPAGEALTVKVERIAALDAREAGRRGLPVLPADRELLRVSAGRFGSADLVRRSTAGSWVLERGAVGLPQPPALPEQGVAVALAADTLDLDALRRAFAPQPPAGETVAEVEPPPVSRVRIEAKNLKMTGHWMDAAKIDAQRRGDQWDIDLASSQARGRLTWNAQGKGHVKGRFEQLKLDTGDGEGSKVSSSEPPQELDELPGLDIEAERFVLDGRQLGRLELQASNERRAWLINRLALTMPEGSFVASGAWGTTLGGLRGRETRLDFTIDTADAGKLLDRLGHAGALRRGTATMKGTLRWQGTPASIDYPTLSGAFDLKAGNGQFSKINPGAGRLLGILSLQALPRRITLDFRDVFSEGFAFDRVEGSVAVERGIMKTTDFELVGPAARVQMSGSANIAAETQNLTVNVQPALSDSVSVGALIANPAVGVATYLAQKVLKDPLGQMFSFRYAVTGSWDDPVVAKLADASGPTP